MTINLADNSPRISYTVAEGVTQTSFAVPFEFFDNGDLNVYIDGTLKTLTTDYTVTGGDGSTGTVSMSVTGGTGGSTVVITRDIALERTTDFPVSGAFNIVALNTELDRIIAVAADLDDRASRALQLTDFDAAAGLTLPVVDDRKGKTLAFNASTGAVEAGPTISDTQTVSAASADIALLADIQDGTTDTNALTNLNNIRTDVSTVSGISSSVTTVASSDTSINILATKYDGTTDQSSGTNLNIAQVDVVADNIASVNTVATNITDVVAVANDLAEVTSEIVTVADDLNEATSEIDTVATNITNVNNVGTDIANVNTVAGQISPTNNISTVAGVSADIASLADIEDGTTATNAISNVATVTSDITTVAGQISPTNNISTVAGLNTEITTVAGDSTNIGAVAGNSTNINAVAGNATNINTVAGLETNINAVASDATDIGTVATDITNVNTVAGSITNVNNVGNNITGVNSFAERYRVTLANEGNPTTSLDQGDLAYVTDDTVLKYFNGTDWVSISPGISNVVDDSTPQLGGNLDVNSNDITGTGNINITGTVSANNLGEHTITATASGAISNGDVVSLNNDGTVTPSGDVTIAYATGSLASINTLSNAYEHARMWVTNTTFVVAYQGTTSDSGSRLVMGSVSGTSITYGTSIQVHSHQTSNAHLALSYDPDLDLILVHYDYGNTTKTAVRVFSYSGTTLSAHSAIALTVEFTRVNSFVYDPDQNTHILIGSDANNGLRGTAVPITISGTTPSQGTAVVFESDATWGGSVAYDTVNQKHVILYSNDTDGDDAYAIVGSLSGGTLSYGTTTSLYTSNSVRGMAIVYDVASGKMVAAFSRMNDFGIVQNRVRVHVLTVSGTSVSSGTQVQIQGAASGNKMQLHGLSYSAALQKTIILFNDMDANVISSEEGTISGTDITFANRTTVLNTFWDREPHLNEGKFVLNSDNQFIGAVRQATSGQVHSLDVYVFQITSTSNNADNYIGVADAAYADGATATIQILGSVDDAQSGLTTNTTYFVANDGSLSTTNNGRKIGRAISATEILIDTAMSGSEMNAYLGGLV
jgi:hypothetical protein